MSAARNAHNVGCMVGCLSVIVMMVAAFASLILRKQGQTEYLVPLGVVAGIALFVGLAAGAYGLSGVEETPDEKKPAADAATDRLLAIYRQYPSGWLLPSAQREIVAIGESLNRQGGMELMRAVHADFTSRSLREGLVGASRNLEISWDRIGQWQG